MGERSDRPYIALTAALLASAAVVLVSLSYFAFDGLRAAGGTFTFGGAARAAASSARRHFTDLENFAAQAGRSAAALPARAAAGLAAAFGRKRGNGPGKPSPAATPVSRPAAGAEAGGAAAGWSGGFSALAAEAAAERREAAEHSRKTRAIAGKGGILGGPAAAARPAPGPDSPQAAATAPAGTGGRTDSARTGAPAEAAAPASARTAAAGRQAPAPAGSAPLRPDELDSLRSGLQKNFEAAAASPAGAAPPRGAGAPPPASAPAREAVLSAFEQPAYSVPSWLRRKKKETYTASASTAAAAQATAKNEKKESADPEPEPAPDPGLQPDPKDPAQLSEQRRQEIKKELDTILAKLEQMQGKPTATEWVDCAVAPAACKKYGTQGQYLRLESVDGMEMAIGLLYTDGRWRYSLLDYSPLP